MPAGNDQAAAVADLIAAGGYTTNVERLIEAAQSAVSPELQAASMKAIDTEATAELDLGSADVPDGHKVLSGAVRGDAAVFVVQDANGRTYKHVQGYADDYEAPVSSSDEVAAAAGAGARASLTQAIAEADAEAKKELEEALAEIERNKAERIAEAQEAAAKEVEAAQAEADKLAEAEADGKATGGSGSGEATGGNDPKQASGPKRAQGKKQSEKQSGGGSK